MIDKLLLKTVIIFSFIIGAGLGIIPLIPAFIWLAFLLLTLFVAPFMLIYLKHLEFIKEYNMEQILTVGAISGFFSCLGFALLYFPIAFILQLIFKIQSFIWIKVLFTNIGFLIPMVILTALISALTNAFSAFLTSYFLFFNQNKGNK